MDGLHVLRRRQCVGGSSANQRAGGRREEFCRSAAQSEDRQRALGECRAVPALRGDRDVGRRRLRPARVRRRHAAGPLVPPAHRRVGPGPLERPEPAASRVPGFAPRRRL